MDDSVQVLTVQYRFLVSDSATPADCTRFAERVRYAIGEQFGMHFPPDIKGMLIERAPEGELILDLGKEGEKVT